jgi:hypothetical protein
LDLEVPAECGELSIVLLKPDGVRSPRVRKDLDRALAAKSLRCVRDRRLTLSEADVIDLWPVLKSSARPIMREFYFRYLTAGPCEAILVSGPVAIERCKHVKVSLRKQYETCAFENVLHSPDNSMERDLDALKLFDMKSASATSPFESTDKRDGFHGKATAISHAEIRAISMRVWQEKEKGGWASIFIPKSNGAYAAVLLPGDPHPIDYGVCLLHDRLGISLDNAIRLYIESDVQKSAVIRTGEYAEMMSIYSYLTDHGLRMAVRDMAGALVQECN